MKVIALKEIPFSIVLPSLKKLSFKKGDVISIENTEDISALKLLENAGYVKIQE